MKEISTNSLDESKEMKQILTSTNTPTNLRKISMKLKHLMQKGNVDGARKLLTNDMSNRILPLTAGILDLLRTKHSETKKKLMRKFYIKEE